MCAALADGRLLCTLGNASAVAPSIENAVEVSVGRGSGCARLRDGGVVCFRLRHPVDAAGRARAGELAIDVDLRRAPELTGATSISTAEDETCAVAAPGDSVWCFSTFREPSAVEQRPTKLELTGVRSIHLGATQGVAVLRSGEVAEFTPRLATVGARVPGLSGVISAGYGNSHGCALHGSGEVSCWGRDWLGLLGAGELTTRRGPLTVADVHDARGLAVGYDHACVWDDGGRVRCWGSDQAGQLGGAFEHDGAHSAKPKSIPGVRAMQLSAKTRTCGIQAGRVTCWGEAPWLACP